MRKRSSRGRLTATASDENCGRPGVCRQLLRSQRPGAPVVTPYFCCTLWAARTFPLMKFARLWVKCSQNCLVRANGLPYDEMDFFGPYRSVSPPIISLVAPLVPFLPVLLGVWNGGHSALRCMERGVADAPAPGSLPSLGRAWARSCALTGHTWRSFVCVSPGIPMQAFANVRRRKEMEGNALAFEF